MLRGQRVAGVTVATDVASPQGIRPDGTTLDGADDNHSTIQDEPPSGRPTRIRTNRCTGSSTTARCDPTTMPRVTRGAEAEVPVRVVRIPWSSRPGGASGVSTWPTIVVVGPVRAVADVA